MTPDELIGRVRALEWLLTTVLIDGIAKSPVPHDALVGVKGMIERKAQELLTEAKAKGDTAEGWSAAAYSNALLDLGSSIVKGTAAAMADKTSARN